MLVDNSQNLACVVQQLVKKFEACFTASSAPVTKSFLDNLQKLPILGHPPTPLESWLLLYVRLNLHYLPDPSMRPLSKQFSICSQVVAEIYGKAS